jgi:hypothetical protein
MTPASQYLSFFKQRHTKLLLLLVLFDLLATIVWFVCYDIPELNPVLAGPIQKSLLNFALTKLALSLPSIYLLNKFLYHRFSQWGVGILLLAYFAVSIFHYYIFINIVTS